MTSWPSAFICLNMASMAMVLEGWMASANSDKDFIKDSSRRAARLLPVSAPISLLKGVRPRRQALSSAARFRENSDRSNSSQRLFAWDIIPTNLQKCNRFFHSYGKNEFCSQSSFRIRHFIRWSPLFPAGPQPAPCPRCGAWRRNSPEPFGQRSGNPPEAAPHPQGACPAGTHPEVPPAWRP